MGADLVYCRNPQKHTKAPDDYLGWHAWAEKKARTHAQERCPGCGLWKVWWRKPRAPKEATDAASV
jgi:hypothetical protein